MLIAMAGLPATGKTTLAGELSTRLPAVVLDKDRVRACLFPAGDIDYSSEQDDFAMSVVFQVAEVLIRKDRERHVIVDGRTFSRAYQVADLLAWAGKIGVPLKVIECVCTDAVAERRLASDTARKAHSAANRTAELYRSLKAHAEPICLPKLVIDPGDGDIASCVERAVAYVRADGDLGTPLIPSPG